MVVKTAWYWYKKKHIAQVKQNRGFRDKPTQLQTLKYFKNCQDTHWKKGSHFEAMNLKEWTWKRLETYGRGWREEREGDIM